jgi:hypothetical protein
MNIVLREMGICGDVQQHAKALAARARDVAYFYCPPCKFLPLVVSGILIVTHLALNSPALE